MKKSTLILTICLALIASTAWASGNLKSKITVTPDQLIPGTTFVGRFEGKSIRVEREYVRAIGVRYGDPVMVEFHLGRFEGRYCPTLIESEYGKFGSVAYKDVKNSFQAWKRDNTSNDLPFSSSDDTGIINSKYFSNKIDDAENSTIGRHLNPVCTSSIDKLYPVWRFAFSLSIPKSVYDSQVKEALEDWGGNLIIQSGAAVDR